MSKLALYLVIGCAGLAAQTALVTNQQTTDMDERTLQEKYHIASTKEGLIGALQHQSRDVRNFAAVKLANDGEKDAIGPILAALAAETVESVKVIQATSAGRLGSAEGVNALKNMCEDRSSPPRLRMTAAQSMVNFLGSDECLPDVLDVLRLQPPDHQASFAALNLLTFKRFKHISAGQLDEIRELSASYLKTQSPDLRLAAGQCIRDVGGPWAISQLRAAIDAEQDEVVRKLLAQDLVSVGQ